MPTQTYSRALPINKERTKLIEMVIALVYAAIEASFFISSDVSSYSKGFRR
jgi:hypothetical protein